VEDSSIRLPPSVLDMTRGSPVLQYDHAIFWKYATSFTHPGSDCTGRTDARSERILVEQVLAGVIRHSAAVYRLITDHITLEIGETAGALREAEEYSRYSFDASERRCKSDRPNNSLAMPQPFPGLSSWSIPAKRRTFHIRTFPDNTWSTRRRPGRTVADGPR
jgi:hypothetical protein